MNKRWLLFIATEKGFTALNHMVQHGLRNRIGAVVTFSEVNVTKNWKDNILQICQQNKIPCFLWKDAKCSIFDIIVQNKITSAATISWKYLLPMELNSHLEDELIVFHDSLLPKYRGFAPTPTAVICGENEIGVTAIYANEQVDQGDIVLQKSIRIEHDMYIDEIIKEQSKLCALMLEELTKQLETNSIIRIPQNEDEATYSVWRSPEDCHIEWDKSAENIYNLIRAVSTPYPGAFTFFDEKKIIIHSALVCAYELNFAIRECGKIWKIEGGNPIVICGKGLLKILRATYEDGSSVRFERVRCRLK